MLANSGIVMVTMTVGMVLMKKIVVSLVVFFLNMVIKENK